MPFANLDDNFADHPKNASLSDSAFRLHVAGILYCARHMTDGLLAADEVPRLVRRFRRGALEELLDRRIWLRVMDGAFEIHDYLQWNDEREVILERRRKNAERVRGWRERRGQPDGQ